MDSLATSQADRIDDDLPCAGCGYNLRTQPSDGRCPECDRPVAESVGGWGPVLTSRASVLRVRRRLALLIAAVCAYEVVQTISRVGFFYSLQMGWWWKPLIWLWSYGGGICYSIELILIAAICFACVNKRSRRQAALAWITLLLSTATIAALALVHISFRQTPFSFFWNFGLSAIAIIVPAPHLARVIMLLLIMGVISRAENRSVWRLILAGLVLSMITLVSTVLWDSTQQLGLRPIVSESIAMGLRRRAHRGFGVGEIVAILHLCIYWILYRRLGAALAARTDRERHSFM